jgi:transcriptional regulator with GAF, ATPase, and Fis domain
LAHPFVRQRGPFHAVQEAIDFGEIGTELELAARAIHLNSRRAQRSFLTVHCATFNEDLLAIDLFGHEKGAFTGAIALKKGKLELVDGGTVFLDEIGKLAPGLQAKLLRVQQERSSVHSHGQLSWIRLFVWSATLQAPRPSCARR